MVLTVYAAFQTDIEGWARETCEDRAVSITRCDVADFQ